MRELVNHIVSGNFWAGALARGRPSGTSATVSTATSSVMIRPPPTTSRHAASEAFHAPGAMEAPCAVSYRPVPGEVYLGHRFIDVVVHGWDVAKGTGQDTTLDPELVEACFTVIEPQKEMLFGSGAFGTDHEPEPGADRQTALLELLGRTP